jgi:hypothetical protein
MRWTAPTAAAVPLAATVPMGAPWPIVLVLGLCGLLVCAWLEYLRYLVDITAVRNAPGDQLASVMRWIRSRPFSHPKGKQR